MATLMENQSTFTMNDATLPLFLRTLKRRTSRYFLAPRAG